MVKTPEIWIAGYPSFVGGADTELDHLIDLWTDAGWPVHLCPLPSENDEEWKPEHCDPRMVESVNARGCVVHPYRPDVFKDKMVFALCNDAVLRELPYIHLSGKPRCLIWANCMTWTMKWEKKAHAAGLIDLFAFQSEYQRKRLTGELSQINPTVNAWPEYRPWFNVNRFPMEHRAVGQYFGVGRVSRDDGAKYHPAMWQTYGQVTAPVPVKAFVLGYGDNAAAVCGKPEEKCPWLDHAYWPMGGTTIQEFFDRIHVLIHLTNGSRENWPRCVMEAWANGVVPVVDDAYGLPEMVTDGVDGFRVKTPEQAAYRASQLAWDDELRQRMVTAGFTTLRQKHNNREVALAGWVDLWESLQQTSPDTLPIPKTGNNKGVINPTKPNVGHA